MDSAYLLPVAAFVLDSALGDPVYPLHPVRLIGRFAALLEKLFFKYRMYGTGCGALFWLMTVASAVAVFTGIHVGLWAVNEYLAALFDVFMLYSTIALTDLRRHAIPVQKALVSGDLERARELVQRIVGRDASRLDAHGVARAAVESVAESFVDGFFAPVFWFFVAAFIGELLAFHSGFLGVAAATAYRVVNTLDSMVGYRNSRYLRFGCFSARADDVLNFIPARLALPFLYLGAWMVCASPIQGAKVWLRDRHKSPSPNSAHTESFAAGALDIQLGGPVIYAHGTVEKPRLGTGTRQVQPLHINSCVRLVFAAGIFSIVAAASLLFLLNYRVKQM